MPFAIIIVIGWLYVTILIAANEPSIFMGLVSFLFYGAIPCGLIIYMSGTRIRRQRAQYRAIAAERNKQNNGA